MADRILTTHVGSLPRPAKVIELNHQRVVGEQVEDAAFDRELKSAVVDLVAEQKRAGIDLVNDGEFGHTMGWDYDYGSWWSYVVRRLNGVEVEQKPLCMQTLTAQIKAPMAPGDSEKSGTGLTYDHVVLALGAVPSFMGLSDVQATAFEFKSLADAIRIRHHVIDLEVAPPTLEEVFLTYYGKDRTG